MDIENRQTDAGAVPVNNDNFDDMAINDGKQIILKVYIELFFAKYLELGSQLVIMSASEAVDNRTCELKKTLFALEI
jgi:hypothetical protein